MSFNPTVEDYQKPNDAKPCPNCNNSRLQWDGWEGSFNVYCPKCKFLGPEGLDKQEAVRKWNQYELAKRF